MRKAVEIPQSIDSLSSKPGLHLNSITSHQASTHPANSHLVYSSAILPSRRTERIQNPRKQLVSRPLLRNPIFSSVHSVSRDISSHSTSLFISLALWLLFGLLGGLVSLILVKCWMIGSYNPRPFLPKHDLLRREGLIFRRFPTELSNNGKWNTEGRGELADFRIRDGDRCC